MNRDESLRIDWLCGQYLAALEQLDFTRMEKIWELAAFEPELEKALHLLHEGLQEEEAQQNQNDVSQHLSQLVALHLPSAAIIPSPEKPFTVAEVITELLKDPRLESAAEMQSFIEKLGTSTEPLPSERALSKLRSWAEARFGTASPRFWQEFQQAALRLDLRRASTADYALAARTAPRER